MTTLYLVRHAKPTAGWSDDPDPGLDSTGLVQAASTAREIANGTRTLNLYTSPLRRCRETAEPLVRMWHQTPTTLPEVAEIPAPSLAMHARREWLTRVMQGTWSAIASISPPNSPDYLTWRAQLLSALSALPHDCVIFSHFIAINVVVGAAQASDKVVNFRPDHASVTAMRVEGNRFEIVKLGRQADTSVLTK